jgi:hypothetical protein
MCCKLCFRGLVWLRRLVIWRLFTVVAVVVQIPLIICLSKQASKQDEAASAECYSANHVCCCCCCCCHLQGFKASGASPFEVDVQLLAQQQPGLVLTQVRQQPLLAVVSLVDDMSVITVFEIDVQLLAQQ